MKTKINFKPNFIDKVVHINSDYYFGSNDLPQKGQQIIVESPNGGYSIDVANRDFTDKECCTGSKRVVWPVTNKIAELY